MKETRKEGSERKFAVAAALQEIGLLLRIKRADQFRSRAYLKASKAIAETAEDLATLIEQKRLTEIRGIGSSLAAVIEEVYSTGRSSLLEKLRAETAPGTIALSQIPGLTTRKIKLLTETLGVTSIDELKQAVDSGAVQQVPGFGPKTQEQLRQQLARYEKGADRLLLVHALATAQKILDYMRSVPDLLQVELAGSARRWKETVSALRFVASSSSDPEPVVGHFVKFPSVVNVERQEKRNATVRLMDGTRVALSVAETSAYSNKLLFETGSRAHVGRLAEIAKQKGFELTAKHLKRMRGRKPVQIEDEADIYRRLDMQYIAPELRERDGEIDAAVEHAIPEDMVTIDDIQGMTHSHTVYSDGRNTVEEMARAAEAMGMEYMTITDHSPTAFYANGVKLDRLKRQWEEIERVQEKVSIRLLRGTESDILRDGELDYPDKILEQFDIIIASIHNRYKLDESEMTRRLVATMKNPLFKIWGHPLGRLVGRRPPIDCRLEEILDVIAESKAAIEISGDPHRLDLEPRWTKEARNRGIKFVISTDAHSISDLYNLKFGIGLARRAWVRQGEVLNALGTKQFVKIVKPA
jgi:DNA polymerase (family 10)